jgi:methionyl-tRNA formyltransferase
VAVLSQPDRPAGRGRKLQASPVKRTALEHGIEVFQPETLRSNDAARLITGFRADLMVVVAYGLILPANILQIPKFGCWNIHASLLPRWRGAAPVQRAIEAGDPESGVCIMQMDEGLDTGALLKCERIPLADDESGGSLHDKLAELGATTLLQCVRALARGQSLPTTPQPKQGVTYARKLDKAEAQIDWSASAAALERQIRAFNPWPVSWCMMGAERTRIWKAEIMEETHQCAPGTVLKKGAEGIQIATGKGVWLRWPSCQKCWIAIRAWPKRTATAACKAPETAPSQCISVTVYYAG